MSEVEVALAAHSSGHRNTRWSGVATAAGRRPGPADGEAGAVRAADPADVSNPEAYAKEYVPKAQALIKKHGGKFLAASNNVVAFEGAPAKRIAIQQWESMEKVKAWQNSAELKENRKIGNKYAKFRILAVEGMPQ